MLKCLAEKNLRIKKALPRYKLPLFLNPVKISISFLSFASSSCVSSFYFRSFVSTQFLRSLWCFATTCRNKSMKHKLSDIWLCYNSIWFAAKGVIFIIDRVMLRVGGGCTIVTMKMKSTNFSHRKQPQKFITFCCLSTSYIHWYIQRESIKRLKILRNQQL